MKLPLQISPAPFPIDALPAKTRQIVGEIQRLTQAPTSSIVSAVLTAMATAAQHTIKIERADRRLSRPNLFMVNIDDSGAGKSEAFTQAFTGLYRCEQIARRITEKKQEQKLSQLSLADKVVQQLNRSNSITNRLIHSSTQTLSRRGLATQSQWRATVVNAEADSVLTDTSLKKLDALSSGWDCQDLRETSHLEKILQDIKDSKDSKVIHAGLYRHTPQISVCLAMRSAALHKYLHKKGSFAHIGSFMERCLFAWAEQPPDGQITPAINAPDALAHFQSATMRIPLLRHSYSLRFDRSTTPNQKELEGFYWQGLNLGTETAQLQAYMSYQYENTLRVAALLHSIEFCNGDGSPIENRVIEEPIFNSAMALIQWHLQIYLHIFLVGTSRDTFKDAASLRNKIQTLVHHQLQSGINGQPCHQGFAFTLGRNELYQQRPDRSMGTERFAQAIALLIRKGLLIEFQHDTPKKWLHIYTDQAGNLARLVG